MTGKFLLFKKNTAIKSYFARGLKELKGLSEGIIQIRDKKKLMSNVISNKFTILESVNVQRNTGILCLVSWLKICNAILFLRQGS